MASLRETIKRAAPTRLIDLVKDLRAKLAAPPFERVVLHDYRALPQPDGGLRLNFVIPSLAPHETFGGVASGTEMYFRFAAKLGAKTRILIDTFETRVDTKLLENTAKKAGLDPNAVEIVHRTTDVEPIQVSPRDVFFVYNSFMALNAAQLIEQQQQLFRLTQRLPIIYIAQEYEPGFHAMSSAHMLSRMAFGANKPTWAIVNTTELLNYIFLQGHTFENHTVFEPKMNEKLVSRLPKDQPAKQRRIFVYGRPTIPRNCFPLIEDALRIWAATYESAHLWSLDSAGTPHKDIPFGNNVALRSLGKLSLDDYAASMASTAIGLSLMASCHPSYPPLEMAHFGVRVLTNAYTCKVPEHFHDNLIGLTDIRPAHIAAELTRLCREFDADPQAGWRGQSHMQGYLEPMNYDFLDKMVADLQGVLESNG